MIEIDVNEEIATHGGRTRWVRIMNGPFPVTREQLLQARAELKAKRDAASDIDRIGGCWTTEGRVILKRVCPHLTNFDLLMLGHAVSMERVRIRTIGGGARCSNIS